MGKLTNKAQFTFQKEYWFINNGKPAKIDVLQSDLDRKRKLSKIIDNINGVEHKHRLSDNEKYFNKMFNKPTNIQLKEDDKIIEIKNEKL